MLSSLKDLYRFGPGPSSSHTIGPYRAAKCFLSTLDKNTNYSFKVTLFGSLALTGKGHLTDKIIKDVLGENTTVIFNIKDIPSFPNTMEIKCFLNDELVKEKTYLSLGGGQIAEVGGHAEEDKLCYPFDDFKSISSYIQEHRISLLDFVKKFDDEDIEEYLYKVLKGMEEEVELGLKEQGYIAGKLHVKRISSKLYQEALKAEENDKRDLLISAYAYAVAEHNSGGGIVVTAPTCGSAGVLPAIIYYLKHHLNYKDEDLIDGIIIAGLIGIVTKKNATISGAVGGCQAEIGTATAMAAAALCAANHFSLSHIEYAAEMGFEHQLGLTCDPVGGYVAIPCIERNSISAIKAYNSYLYAKHLIPYRHNAISLDEVIEVMRETGTNLSSDYKETAKGGLAKIHKL